MEPAAQPVWGAHLNKAKLPENEVSKTSSKKAKAQALGSGGLAKSLSFTADDSSFTSVRTNLKKSKKKKSSSQNVSSFFDTWLDPGGGGDTSAFQIGDIGTVTNSEKQQLGEQPIPKTKSDPLARFDPEISMDSCSQFSSTLPTSNTTAHEGKVTSSSKKPANNQSTTTKSLSFLGTFSSSSTSNPKEISFSSRLGSGKRCFGQMDVSSEDFNAPSKKFKLDDTRDMFADDDEEEEVERDGGKENNAKYENSKEKTEEKWAEVEKRLTGPTHPQRGDGGLKLDVYELGLEDDDQATGLLPMAASSSRYFASKGQRLEQKMVSGTCNENYQKIDLKKKNFVRGKKTMTGAKHRRIEWKRKQVEKDKANKKAATAESRKKAKAAEKDASAGDGTEKKPRKSAAPKKKSVHPKSKKPASKAARNSDQDWNDKKLNDGEDNSNPGESEQTQTLANDDDEGEWGDIDENLLLKAESSAALSISNGDATSSVEPYYRTEGDYNQKEVLAALAKFGHDSFRGGQEESIKRVLCGRSTLVQLATGSGKSLVYQLPAYLYARKQRCITLVVAPLISLMQDQIENLPPFLKGACFHSMQRPKEREAVLENVKTGRLHFLLVSPETLAGGGSLFTQIIKNLPPIAFVCIDEAHCISTWSHNFRPTYLRICKFLHERLGVKTVLGLTASAPEGTLQDVATRLRVDNVVRGPLLPNNLVMTVSKDKNKEDALLDLLRSTPYTDFDSIIVYCTRREVCENLATLIRTQFQERDVSQSVRKTSRCRPTSLVAEAYHAGLSAHKRKTVQNFFMSGRLRIVVATVAFGMGIDKSDIRAVIHFNMPGSFESYVQETGRAGRDGLPARCHLFLEPEGGDLNELKRHIFVNSVDRHAVRKLVQSVFGKSQLGQSEEKSDKKEESESQIDAKVQSDPKAVEPAEGKRYREVALPIAALVEKLDMPEENIATFMCYLEEHERKWVRILNPTYATCTLHFYNQDSKTRLGALNPIMSKILEMTKGDEDAAKAKDTVKFPVIDLAADNGWQGYLVKRELKNMQWSTVQAGGAGSKKSGMVAEFSDLAIHFDALACVAEQDLNELQDYLYGKTASRECLDLHSLHRLYRAFTTVSFSNFSESEKSSPEDLNTKNLKLKELVSEYFSSDGSNTHQGPPRVAPINSETENYLRAEVRSFVSTHSEHVWTGRAVARVFHGIQSPNFPAKQWGRVRRYWRAHLKVDFNILCKIATKEVIQLRSGRT